MIATVTIGKRRAGMPSESGSMSDIVVVPRVARIGEVADALRKATSSARQDAEIAHRFGVLADSRRRPRRQSGRRQSKPEVVNGNDSRSVQAARADADHKGSLGPRHQR